MHAPALVKRTKEPLSAYGVVSPFFQDRVRAPYEARPGRLEAQAWQIRMATAPEALMGPSIEELRSLPPPQTPHTTRIIASARAAIDEGYELRYAAFMRGIRAVTAPRAPCEPQPPPAVASPIVPRPKLAPQSPRRTVGRADADASHSSHLVEQLREMALFSGDKNWLLYPSRAGMSPRSRHLQRAASPRDGLRVVTIGSTHHSNMLTSLALGDERQKSGRQEEEGADGRADVGGAEEDVAMVDGAEEEEEEGADTGGDADAGCVAADASEGEAEGPRGVFTGGVFTGFGASKVAASKGGSSGGSAGTSPASRERANKRIIERAKRKAEERAAAHVRTSPHAPTRPWPLCTQHAARRRMHPLAPGPCALTRCRRRRRWRRKRGLRRRLRRRQQQRQQRQRRPRLPPSRRRRSSLRSRLTCAR